MQHHYYDDGTSLPCKNVCVWRGGVSGGDRNLNKKKKKCCFFVAVEESQQMYQLRKVALEARRNKPDLNCHYTKIKVPQIKIAHVVLFHSPYM